LTCGIVSFTTIKWER